MAQTDLVVNCRFLARPVTGVERFAFEIVTRLVETVDHIALVAPPNVRPETRIAGRAVQRVGRLRGHLWEQVSLPRFLRSVGSPTLLDLANTGPVLWSKQLYVLHDVAFITHPESYRMSFRLAYRVLAGTLVRRAAHVATVSDFSRDEIVRVFGADVHVDVIPNGISAFLSEPGELDFPELRGREYLLAVGSAAAHKNTSRLMEAYARVRSHVRDAPYLVIVGGSARGFHQPAPTNDAPGTVMLGRVSDGQLAQLYSNATAFIYPSLYEGFGIPPLEAQAAGVPLVVSHRRPFTDLINESSAVWCDPEDTSSIASAIEQVMRSADLRTRLIENGFANARRFSWDASARQVMAILSGVTRTE